MKIEVHILDTDHRYYMTSENKCSRCRRELRDDEVPLRFWPQPEKKEDRYYDYNRDWMLVYCDDCLDDVLRPQEKEDPD